MSDPTSPVVSAPSRVAFALAVLPLLPVFSAAQNAPTPPAPTNNSTTTAAANSEAHKLDDFVVTGVFNATEVKKATTAITTVDSELMAMQVPLSADDLLLNVAGVFVNSSLGEIRGMVYSRGISADSSDGANGQYYVTMQEDGLPITNVTFGNYGAGYFNRPDATLFRVEAVRGGSASVGSSRVDLQACKLEYSIVSPK